MKKVVTLIICLSLIGGLAVINSCKKDSSNTVADPDGTITLNLSNDTDVAIWDGLADKPYYNYPYMFIGFHMTSNLNTWFNITVCPDASNPHGENFYNTGAEAANMGKVDGLGNVTTKPSSGYSKTSAIEKGHGYVLRYRKSYDQSDSTLPYFYARFYVVEWLTSATSGGIIGATIKFQGPF